MRQPRLWTPRAQIRPQITLAPTHSPSILYTHPMADLVLVYGLRLLPADEIASVRPAPIVLNNGHDAQVTMHILEGSRERIEAQLRHSIDAFFDFYPEI